MKMRIEHFENLHIKINLKVNISETNETMKFCTLSIFKIYNMQY